MGKKKKTKKQKTTVYAVFEGQREGLFLEFLRNIYKPENNNINVTYKNANGGDASTIISLAQNDRNRSFVWLDEDFQINNPPSKGVRKNLANCWNVKDDKLNNFLDCTLGNLQSTFNRENRSKPTLIVSQPIAVESLILTILGKELPHSQMDTNAKGVKNQCKDLKNKLESFLDGCDELQYYRDNISKEMLEEKCNTIPELNLLISMITK